jgi:hypothetical protein
MLLQLMQAGVLGRQQALVLGDFSGYRLAPMDNGYDFDAMLAYLRATLPCPVLTGLEFGHIPRRVTIPFGAQGTAGVGYRRLAPDDVRLPDAVRIAEREAAVAPGSRHSSAMVKCAVNRIQPREYNRARRVNSAGRL